MIESDEAFAGGFKVNRLAGKTARYLAEFDLGYSIKDKSDTMAPPKLFSMEGRRLRPPVLIGLALCAGYLLGLIGFWGAVLLSVLAFTIFTTA